MSSGFFKVKKKIVRLPLREISEKKSWVSWSDFLLKLFFCFESTNFGDGAFSKIYSENKSKTLNPNKIECFPHCIFIF